MAVHIRTRRIITAPIETLYESARETGVDAAHCLTAVKQLETFGVSSDVATNCATQMFHQFHAKQRLAEEPEYTGGT